MTAYKGAGAATVTYNSNALTNYVNSVDLQNTIAELEATHLGSTGEESDPGLVNSTLNLGGDWHATLDGYLGPDSIAGTKRTAVITFTAGSTVTWTWTSKAYITNFKVNTAAKDKITWTAQLRLSGLGVRT
jgi:hypothetical protein